MMLLRNKSPIITFILPAHFYILYLTPQTQQKPSLKARDNLLLETVLFEEFLSSNLRMLSLAGEAEAREIN